MSVTDFIYASVFGAVAVVTVIRWIREEREMRPLLRERDSLKARRELTSSLIDTWAERGRNHARTQRGDPRARPELCGCDACDAIAGQMLKDGAA